MIIKSFELDKIKIKFRYFLFFGENQGHKNEVIKNIFQNKEIIVPGFLNKFRYLLLIILPNFIVQYIYHNK